MRITCILCDQPFSPTARIAQRLQKQPHRLVLCERCNQKIAEQTRERRKLRSSS